MNTASLLSDSTQPARTPMITAQNIIFFDEWTSLQKQCHCLSLFIVPLKGISFINRIYDVSQRFMTDIDVYTPQSDLERLKEVLAQMEYSEQQEKKWHENSHKTLFTKKRMGLEIVLEVHTQLVPHCADDQWSFTKESECTLLEAQDELIYLSYHYASQHTLMDVKWLKDIYLLTKTSMPWEESLWLKARKKNLTHSLLITAQALNLKYNTQIEVPKNLRAKITHQLIDMDFLENATNHKLKYFLIKHLVKPSLAAALLFNLRWLIFFVKNGFKS